MSHAAYGAPVTPVLADPRVAPVEDNLMEFLRVTASNPAFGTEGAADLHTWHTTVPHPVFNGIAGARFAPGEELRRTREVLAAYVGRGLPFLWWGSPSTMTTEIADALVAAGMLRDETPGMHRVLDGPVPMPPPGPGVRLHVVGPECHAATARVMTEGFGFPAELAGPIVEMMAPFDAAHLLTVLATVDGRPVACGTAWLTGRTAGLYNITTLEAARGRGIGYAVTATLLEMARDRGCTEAILHATELGRPVYERLGFEEVCRMPMFVWVPQL